ncbi:MAG TPA: stage IV sporulation protein A [Firmicutes bacterium]|nr:stage IV sporulation protein A [Bacillota bacterium]HHY98390.1 stage IV sporulation protein A [Bacillota bacterium]
MEKFDVLRDIQERTGGDVYIGVVGPVRTGKSTFIRRFMELFVLPNIKDAYDRQRSIDELPQGGAGKTIMTTEPKFIPSEAVGIDVAEGVHLNVRIVDCVGYTVEGALGYREKDGLRMVATPWFDHEIPFEEAAEVGTRKVISEHSTIGLVVTTDGSIVELPREAYVSAERRVVQELRDLGKPFVVILNSTHPDARETRSLAAELEGEYGVRVMPLNCAELETKDVAGVLQEVLYEFPVREMRVTLPIWLRELSEDHQVRQQFEQSVTEAVRKVRRVRDVSGVSEELKSKEFIERVELIGLDLGHGKAELNLVAPRSLFFAVLNEASGLSIDGDHDLLRIIRDLATAKREYDKVAQALDDVRNAGYGIVMPLLDEITFEEPELIRQGNRFGVKLKAVAPSIHMIRADIRTEVTTMVGTEKQGEEMVRRFSEEFESDPGRIWQTDFLGKSLYEIVQDGLESKLVRMPENAQQKLQETLSKIINEGSGGLICIIL